MITSLLLTFLLTLTTVSPVSDQQKWGKNGHRIVGEIAADYLSEEARQRVHELLGPESIAIASTWMDKIRSDTSYDYTSDWHWVTIPDGMTYEETEKNPDGDLIQALRSIIEELKTGELPGAEEKEKLKMLIHLVGDLHQPMHVGTGNDRGGNDTRVEWFYEPSNLHRVWDSGMIDETKLSYTEFTAAINHPTAQQIDRWQQGTITDWAHEVMELRNKAYALPDDRQIGYRYMYVHRQPLDRQLLKGGIRLAAVLNEIYG
ncbi:S1/P1 nuclease [Fodinibius sediminis]|uniref:S1/P1 Nuclease n=1 Tax=Fodinibius sediminis TaxID=1214077 RepID=A0A521C7G2_9BACT|nr:S1/P1 nuclease [Fodinibius sediminis]SMO55412.1 S1/P1 Nuclease [Fodinibius sediminis]